MDDVELKTKAEEDLKAAEEFFEPANLQAITALSSILSRLIPPDCGHRTKRTPTLDELDKWR